MMRFLVFTQAMFLQPKLLGVLAFFNFILINSSSSQERKVALKSIVCLLKILGKRYLTPVRLKVNISFHL